MTIKTKDMHKIELFENGEFSITTKSFGIVRGRFSMSALDFFCEQHNIESYLELLMKVKAGMKIGQYADYILSGIKDVCRREKTECKLLKEDVLDIIDEFGGISSDEFIKLMKHGYSRIVKLQETEKDDEILRYAQDDKTKGKKKAVKKMRSV
jgi:hypothetical protein